MAEYTKCFTIFKFYDKNPENGSIDAFALMGLVQDLQNNDVRNEQNIFFENFLAACFRSRTGDNISAFDAPEVGPAGLTSTMF
jgi:hypothetical protein